MPAPERRQNVLPASSMPVRNSPVLQGEFRISNDPRECLVTVLGSCVATCLWDDEAGVGGMVLERDVLLLDGLLEALDLKLCEQGQV